MSLLRSLARPILRSSPSTAAVLTQCKRTMASSDFSVEFTKKTENALPEKGQLVTVHYTGRLLDGSTFDSSRTRGTPFQFTLGAGQVIKGWDEGVAKMPIGSTAIITCPPDYAYGKRGFPPVIPANATLKFDVEVISAGKK